MRCWSDPLCVPWPGCEAADDALSASPVRLSSSAGRHELLITLNVPDEEKVELFEVKDPSGKKRIFSKFEDGMVYFKFTGLLPPGIWSYHAKLYHDSLYPDTKMTVDVITKCEEDTGIVAEVK